MTYPTFADLHRAIDVMVKYQMPEWQIDPHCAIFAKAVLAELEAKGGMCPQLLPEPDLGISLTFKTIGGKAFWSISPDDIDVFEIDFATGIARPAPIEDGER